jgi:hypothetical protein
MFPIIELKAKEVLSFLKMGMVYTTSLDVFFEFSKTQGGTRKTKPRRGTASGETELSIF